MSVRVFIQNLWFFRGVDTKWDKEAEIEDTLEETVTVAKGVLTMRENITADIARLRFSSSAKSDIRNVVRFRRSMQSQSEEWVSRMERPLRKGWLYFMCLNEILA